LKHEYEVEVRWIAYPLNPYLPGAAPIRFAPDSAYDPKTILQKTTKTRQAQELTKWAQSNGLGEAFCDALWEANYVTGKDIDSRDTLLELAESVNLSRDDAEEALNNMVFKDAVDADWLRSLEVDPQYVPSVSLNGDLLANPQQYGLLEQLLVRHRVKRRTR
jgi:predicted DsbA family dithiol-disulfide isomerase